MATDIMADGTHMAAMMMDGKPVCGGDQQVGEYDVGIHVLGLFLVLAFSIFGAGFPVVAKKVKWIKIPPKIFFACKHFGTGVLIATAFVHLLPTAFGNLLDPCLPDLFTTYYPPMPGVIMMASMFCLFVIEMWLNGKTGGHSHGGPMGIESGPHEVTGPMMVSSTPQRPPRYDARRSFETEEDIDYEKKLAKKEFEENVRNQLENPFVDKSELGPPSEMPPWFIVFYEQYVRQRLEMMNMIRATSQATNFSRQIGSSEKAQPVVVHTGPVIDSPYVDVETGIAVHPDVYRKMSLNITLLEGGILFHSVFVGMTISITIDGFIILLVAILFHQMFEGLGLGSRIAAVPYKKGSIRPWVLVVAFGTTAPIGQAIGLVTRSTYDPNSAFGLIIVGVFNAISSGLLLYAALVDLLAEDFLSEEANRVMKKKDKVSAFMFVLAGAAGMSVVGAFA
ncbi:Zinc/iron permease [Coniochaeta hoffmannii]|uniref:Zinc/iron permease n=1 Tax=Coniochaeta hoffmannii TaxID=91930 RepID=A0AA38S358_9PEZI|nr:Zinc/iron permease [Coniochaeta hoffmannii]